ncbi:MAG: hypothetical protein OXG24_00230 [Gammaproteobacteria bacterium]|nr:hypothetical protein [Gammaproteobacteria bacterium]
MADQKETIQWDQFIDACRELSEAQYQEGWDQEAHTKEVESLLERLRLTEEQRDKFLSKYENRIPDFPEIGHLHYERRFMISLVEFEKGDVIPLHDHPDMTGVVLCIEGRVDVQHFDKLEETSNSNRPLLQEERTVQMKPGDIATLTTERGNIHTLQALEFSRMIDVFTPPYDQDRASRALYYKIESSTYEGREGVYEVISSSNTRN